MTEPTPVTELIGVYDADGSVTGELAYLLRRATGRGHCALCDISHGALRRRPSFDRAVARLPVPLHMLHRDELDAPAAAAIADALPCILAAGPDGIEILVDRSTLQNDVCDADDLVDLILHRLALGGEGR